MKFLLMALVPILAAGVWVFIDGQDQFLLVWISLATIFATLESLLYEKVIAPKIAQNAPLAPNSPLMPVPEKNNTFVTTLLIYFFSLSFFFGMIFLVKSDILLQKSTPTVSGEAMPAPSLNNAGVILIVPESTGSSNDGTISETGILMESGTLADTGTITETGILSATGEVSETGVLTETGEVTETGIIAESPAMPLTETSLPAMENTSTQVQVDGPKLMDTSDVNVVKEKIIYSDEPFGEPNGDSEAGLDDLITRGYIRKATDADHDAWKEAVLSTPNTYITKITGYPLADSDKTTIGTLLAQERFGRDYYVVMKNVNLPSGLFWKHNFYILKGIKRPGGNISNGSFYDFNTLNCASCHLDFGSLDTNGVTTTQKFDSNTLYLAGGAYGGKKTDKQIDSSGHNATLFDVYVNSPKKPVVLILGAYEPSVWSVRVSEGTVIQKVILGGYHGQEIVGVSKTIPVEKHTYEDNKSNDFFYISEGSTLVASLKKYGNVEKITYANTDAQIILGETITGKEKWTTDTSTTIEDFYNTTEELAGEAGLDVLIQKGYLRKATRGDYEDWTYAVMNAPNTYVTKKTGYPVSNEKIVSTKEKIMNSFNASTNYYVALKDFTLPGGMYWKFGFLIPKGINLPKGSISNGVLYDFNTLSCTGYCSFDSN